MKRPSQAEPENSRALHAEMSSKEDELSTRAARGDLAAAERLAELTYERIFAALVKLSGDPDLAADLTQETYRKAWASIHTFRGGAKFSTWLYRIAYNLFLNHIRKPHRLSPFDDEMVNAVLDPAPSQEEALTDSRAAARVRRAVVALPEELRFAVTARYWAEIPVREIAADQGLSPVGIRKRLLRAYTRLAGDLADEAPSSEVAST